MICSYSFCILSGGDEHFYMFICDLSIFMISTAFVDTKAKHILIEWTNSQIYDIIIKKFQPFSKSVSIWVKAFNEVQTSEQTRCRKNHN